MVTPKDWVATKWQITFLEIVPVASVAAPNGSYA